MMKRLLLGLALLVACTGSAEARARYTNWCGVGNQAVTIVGSGTSTTKWQLSAPSCTITVYLTGTNTLASLYTNNSGTVLANPFTAQTNGMFYFYSNNGRFDVVMSGGGLPTSVTLGDVFLIDTASITPGSSEWSSIIDPTGNLALAMATYTTAFTWGNLTGVSNALSLTDGTGSTSTGSLLNLATGSGSTIKPIKITAQGSSNGVQMSSAGALTAIGTGSIGATTLSCTACVTDSMINSITTRAKLPSTIAYEDEANEFTQAQLFDSTIGIKGGTAFTMTISGTPSANRNITIPDATSTLVNLSSTQTLSDKTFSDDLVWTSGTAFTGTLAHANSANRVYTYPDATGTVLMAPSLTSGSVIFTNGTVLTQDNATFFWNNTTKSLGIGNAAPAASLHVQPRATASQVAMRVQGNSTANTDVLQVYNSAGSPTKISYFGSNGALNTALTLTSTLATGTSPLTVASTTKVDNLNVDSLDGFDWAIPGSIGATTPNAGSFTKLTLPATTTSVLGTLTLGGARFLHAFNDESNLFLGTDAGNFTNTGTNDIGIGKEALTVLTSGVDNVGIGTFSLHDTTDGISNSAVGSFSLENVIGGDGNTAIGISAGAGVTTGNNNSFLGNTADTSSGSVSNSTAIGNGATVAGSNTIQLGNGSVVLVKTFGAIESAIATGTAPLTIASTTPVTNLHTRPIAYNAAGTQQVNGHIVFGTCTIGSTCSVTLTGSAAYTSTSSYYCASTDMTAAAAVKVVNTSASQVDFTGTGTDVLAYVCFGT